MNRKGLKILTATLLLTLLSAFTYERKPNSAKTEPTTVELAKLGKQMAATVIRGVAWPTKNTIKGCWREDEVPNIDINAEIMLDPNYDAVEPTYLKMNSIIIQPSQKAIDNDFYYTEDGNGRAFTYAFYLRRPMAKKKKNNRKVRAWVSCKPKKGATKLCRLVRKKHRQLFRIKGVLQTPTKARVKELKALRAEGNRSVVPNFEVYFGDVWATQYLRVIRRKCAMERAL